MAIAAVAACDEFKQQDEPKTAPPFVHVVAANVGATMLLPQDGVIRIAFDRYLNPQTINRQGIGLRDSFGNAPDSPNFDYDPVTRVVTISNPNPGQTWLTVGQPYELAFPISTGEAGSFGLRAIDGATMDPATSPNIGFMIAAPTGTPPTAPTISFCSDVFPIFGAPDSLFTRFGACSASTCHGIPQSKLMTAEGLVLGKEDGIRHTAIGVLAEETATAALSTPLTPQTIFPTGMPIIDPGNPGNSFLMYKLLEADNGTPDDGPTATLSYTACKPITSPFDYGPGPGLASPDEAARLANLIPGRRMPWGTTPTFDKTASLTLDQMERIRLWILQGALVDDCSACGSSQN